MNVKLFNLMSGVNVTRFLVQHESCKSRCVLKDSVYNSKQKQNHDQCQYEFKELDNWSSYKDDYVIMSVIRHVKLMNIKILKITHAKNI